jgi:hypothetical protein
MVLIALSRVTLKCLSATGCIRERLGIDRYVTAWSRSNFCVRAIGSAVSIALLLCTVFSPGSFAFQAHKLIDGLIALVVQQQQYHLLLAVRL